MKHFFGARPAAAMSAASSSAASTDTLASSASSSFPTPSTTAPRPGPFSGRPLLSAAMFLFASSSTFGGSSSSLSSDIAMKSTTSLDSPVRSATDSFSPSSSNHRPEPATPAPATDAAAPPRRRRLPSNWGALILVLTVLFALMVPTTLALPLGDAPMHPRSAPEFDPLADRLLEPTLHHNRPTSVENASETDGWLQRWWLGDDDAHAAGAGSDPDDLAWCGPRARFMLHSRGLDESKVIKCPRPASAAASAPPTTSASSFFSLFESRPAPTHPDRVLVSKDSGALPLLENILRIEALRETTLLYSRPAMTNHIEL
ncbi:hypothetical protein H9P43_006215 [Blastocladiella emersonii ATCC 22665]|nr:hypothetical protein H9P43_006215 [Blastocladiella emersonii ATCC 22665]